MSKGYWTERDKKETSPSPTLLSTDPWPSEEEEKDDQRKENDVKEGVL